MTNIDILNRKQFADIFSYNVKFNVYYGAFFYLAEICVLESVGDDCDIKTIRLRVADSKAYAVNAY